MVIFILGAVGCALAPTIGWLTVFRFIQGLGAAAVMVIPRAIIRDQHTGTQATRMMALIMLVISISPMLAPLVGSGVLMLGSWRLLFWVLCVVGLFFDGTALPMVAAIALCAVAAMGLALLVLPRLAVSQATALRP